MPDPVADGSDADGSDAARPAKPARPIKPAKPKHTVAVEAAAGATAGGVLGTAADMAAITMFGDPLLANQRGAIDREPDDVTGSIAEADDLFLEQSAEEDPSVVDADASTDTDDTDHTAGVDDTESDPESTVGGGLDEASMLDEPLDASDPTEPVTIELAPIEDLSNEPMFSEQPADELPPDQPFLSDG